MCGVRVMTRIVRRMHRSGTVRRAALLLVALVAAWAPGVARAGGDREETGQVTPGSVVSNGTEYPYLLYTPTSYKEQQPAPLVVVVHGCQTNADQQMRSSLFNPLADRERFVVMYPDVDALGRLQPGPANNCWKFPYPPAWTRDGSDAGAIADMTRAVMTHRNIDPERVYIVGASAGGLMASIEAAAYPDLYTAVGLVAAAGYVDWPCFTTGVGIPVELSAQLAYREMGARARVVPRFVLGGTADAAFPPACVVKALEQGLRTNNLVVSGQQTKPIPLTPAAVRAEQVPDGYAYTVSSYDGPDGCLVGELWMVEGLPHSWPGGTSVPEDQYNNDTKAPDGAETSWAFFQRHRRSDTTTTTSACRPLRTGSVSTSH
jgi:poly(hydroxyalkanoate) depolymerase family esterase